MTTKYTPEGQNGVRDICAWKFCARRWSRARRDEIIDHLLMLLIAASVAAIIIFVFLVEG